MNFSSGSPSPLPKDWSRPHTPREHSHHTPDCPSGIGCLCEFLRGFPGLRSLEDGCAEEMYLIRGDLISWELLPFGTTH